MSIQSFDIVGKNSRLYKSIEPLLGVLGNEYSYHEIDSAKLINPIVFSFDRSSFEANQRLLDTIIQNSEGRVVYISTTAIFSNVFGNAYKYARIKKDIENYLLRFENVFIVRVGLVEGFADSRLFGNSFKFTSRMSLVNSIKNSITSDKPQRITDAWENEYENNSRLLSRIVYCSLYSINQVVKSNFHLTRPIDLVLKLIGEKNYGYTFLSNRFEVHTDYVVVGGGMSALGVLEALEAKGVSSKVRIIHAGSSGRKYYEKSKFRKAIESVGGGGNSNLWHSVISRFKSDGDVRSKANDLFNKLYPHSAKKFKHSDWSFIPIFPIRPLKKLIAKKRSIKDIIDDTILYIEKSEEGKILVHGARATYTTDVLFLCTGALSSIRLLTDSKLVGTHESSLSEHLVGYFGQFSGKLRDPQIIRSVEGHFKKFHEIELENRRLYVTFRPANFQFRNLKTANSYREFFGSSSNSILLSLLRKFNIGLILEAFYNKFGIDFNLTRRYNISGHIESRNTVNISCAPFSDIEVDYSEKLISFTEREIDTIRNYLFKLGIESQVDINPRTNVSPGLHFLNSSLKKEIANLPEGIRLFSTILFEDESPSHPTFDLFVSSYVDTLKLLN